jgi:hypothetical protein
LYIVQKEELPITCYMCVIHTLDERPSIRDKRECYIRTMTAGVQLKKKISGHVKGLGTKMN